MSKIFFSRLPHNEASLQLNRCLQRKVKGGFVNVEESNQIIFSHVQNWIENIKKDFSSLPENNAPTIIKFEQTGINTNEKRIIQNGNNSISVNFFPKLN